ncbi:hypothetical protein D0U04_01150 [Bacillus clarus]|uniref:Uncharacterized protein n=1 Tax=Bacillus clarus TaxID=2338372 RepID=A0ABX9L1I7_9BACI|nr:hypothetical protein D0U04_01150 [Bacillus clarus]
MPLALVFFLIVIILFIVTYAGFSHWKHFKAIKYILVFSIFIFLLNRTTLDWRVFGLEPFDIRY